MGVVAQVRNLQIKIMKTKGKRKMAFLLFYIPIYYLLYAWSHNQGKRW